MRNGFLICSILFIMQLSTLHVNASNAFDIQGATSFATLNLTPNSTLNAIMTNIDQRIYVENIEAQGLLGEVITPASDLTSIMASITKRIYVENVEIIGLLSDVIVPVADLTSIMASITKRIYVENVEVLGTIGEVTKPPTDLTNMLNIAIPVQSLPDEQITPTPVPQITPRDIESVPTPTGSIIIIAPTLPAATITPIP